jgi:hypothetical protein
MRHLLTRKRRNSIAKNPPVGIGKIRERSRGVGVVTLFGSSTAFLHSKKYWEYQLSSINDSGESIKIHQMSPSIQSQI